MNIKRYFETSENEPRLIDVIAVFYLIQVLFYTRDDFKGNYPIVMVTMGLMFHLIALLTWLDENKVKSYFGTLKSVVYKLLPIGLTTTYAASIFDLFGKGGLTYANYYNIGIFMATALPMIMFYASMGFNIRNFDFLKQQRKGTNNLFIGFLVVIFIGQRIINN